MERNYIQKRVLSNVMKDRNIGKALVLEKTRNVVLGVMEKQGVKTDIGKMKGYKKDEFLKAIDNTMGVGFYAKKAFHETYGKGAQQASSRFPKRNEGFSMRKTYDDIMSKRKNPSAEIVGNNLPGNNLKSSENKVLNFRSNSNIRNAESLIAKPVENRHHIYDNHHIAEAEDEAKSLLLKKLHDIQS